MELEHGSVYGLCLVHMDWFGFIFVLFAVWDTGHIFGKPGCKVQSERSKWAIIWKKWTCWKSEFTQFVSSGLKSVFLLNITVNLRRPWMAFALLGLCLQQTPAVLVCFHVSSSAPQITHQTCSGLLWGVETSEEWVILCHCRKLQKELLNDLQLTGPPISDCLLDITSEILDLFSCVTPARLATYPVNPPHTQWTWQDPY